MVMEIDGWQVVRRLSMSAIAEVFLVRPQQKGALQVLKRLLPVYTEEPGLVEIFQREAALGPHLVHPNLPRVLSSGSDDGVPYIVLEHIRGCSLGQLMDRLKRPLDPRVAVALARDVVDRNFDLLLGGPGHLDRFRTTLYNGHQRQHFDG